MTRLLSKLQTFLLCVWIFLIPTSLAYHYNKSAGLVHGVLVDYRIPTVTATAIVGLLALLSAILLKQIPFVKTISYTLWGTSLFQYGWAVMQWFTQRSLTRYIPFGEPAFSSPQIVKSAWIDGTLKILPYGTTVHPHLLATFIVIAVLLSLQLGKTLHDKNLRFFHITLLCMALIICLLTQSFVAFFALVIGLFMHFLTTRRNALPIFWNCIRVVIILIPLFSILFFQTPWARSSQNTSILRRFQLESISLNIIQKHPLLGVGWNNFTRDMEQYGYVSSTVRFLQPVHNVPLLLISELGLVGWFVIAVLIVMVLRASQQSLSLISALIVIASFDHFLLTLTTGRMLVILILFCPLFSREKS